MTNATFTKPTRWTEDELKREIDSLEVLLQGDAEQAGPTGGRCAKAYLRQVLKDRRATLRLLRFRQKQTVKPAETSQPAPSLAWPMPRPVQTFQPLLQV